MIGIKIVFKTYLTKRTFWQWLTRKPKRILNSSVTVYEPGTHYLKITYTDATKEIMNTNPIIIDNEGKAEFWIEEPGKRG